MLSFQFNYKNMWKTNPSQLVTDSQSVKKGKGKDNGNFNFIDGQ